jgi:hypothetical protein
MKRKISSVTIVLWLLLMTLTVSAQSGGNYDLAWSSIDGGGGTSIGGNFSLSGTIGQADAGIQSGGGYTLEGGFWNNGASKTYRVFLPVALK